MGDLYVMPFGAQKSLQITQKLFIGEIIRTSELGLIHTTNLEIPMFDAQNELQTLRCGEWIANIRRPASNTNRIVLPIYSFTHIGAELIKMIAPLGDRDHLIATVRQFLGEGMQCVIGKVVRELPGGIVEIEESSKIDLAP